MGASLAAAVLAPACAAQDSRPVPPTSRAFQAFRDTVTVDFDDRFVRIASSGLPDHRMMVGIRAWNRQVPLPQPYSGENAWRLPLHPAPARAPRSARTGGGAVPAQALL